MTTAADLEGPATLRVSLPELVERLAPPHRRLDIAAGGLVLLQVAIYAIVALPGSFYLDDLTTTNRAAASDLTLSYLRGPDGHHLAPASLLWLWVQAHTIPLNHPATVLVMLLVEAVVGWAMWLLLRSLFGARPLALAPLALFALTPVSLPTFAWWVQALVLLPVHLSIIGATYQHLAYLRTRRLRHAGLAGAWVLLGMLSWEKGVLAVVLPFLLTLVVFTGGGVRKRLRALASLWPSWVALLLPPALFGLIYSQQDRQSARSVGVSEGLGLLADSTTHLVLPSLLGGPWRWTTKEFYGVADPTGAAVGLSLAVVAVLLIVSTWHRPWALRGWVLLALYVPLSLAPVAAGRLAQYGSVIGRDSRYVSDISVAMAVATGLVLMRQPRPEGPLAAVGRRSAVLAAVAGSALLVSSLVSDAHFGSRWHENPVGTYLGNLRHDLTAARTTVNLYDGQVPVSVISPFYAPDNRLSSLLRQLPGEARFDDGQRPLSIVAADGHIVPARLTIATRDIPGPAGECGYPIKPTARIAHVRLARPVDDFVGRTVRVELLLSAPTSVPVVLFAGTRSISVSDARVLPRGPAAVVAQIEAGVVDRADIGPLAKGVFACVLSVTVGKPEPVR